MSETTSNGNTPSTPAQPETTSTSSTTTGTTTKSSGKTKTLTIISIVAVALFAVSLAGNIWLLNKNKVYKQVVDNSKTKIQVMEAEKTELQEKVTLLSDQKQTLDRSLAVAFNNMQAKDIVIDRLNKENTTLTEIKEQVGELDKISNTMNGQLKNLNSSREMLKQVQEKVNKTIATKQDQNKKIKEKLK